MLLVGYNGRRVEDNESCEGADNHMMLCRLADAILVHNVGPTALRCSTYHKLIVRGV
jgi:hypothetical protein